MSNIIRAALAALSLVALAVPPVVHAQTVGVSSVSAPTAPPTDLPPRPATRRPSRAARAELATVQTLIGGAMGAEICGMAECDEPRAWAGAVLLGAGAGTALSLLTTRDGIPQGRAQAVNAGTVFGTWLGAGTALALGRSDPNPQAVAGLVAGGQLLGAGLGLLTDHTFIVTPGEVSLANSGALWTGITSVLALAAIAPEGDGDRLRRRFSGTTLATTTLGLAGGAWLARHDHVSRGRALMVDVGAIAGGGMLPLVGWFIGGDDPSAEGLLWASAAGTAGGAILAYALTRTWDAPEVPDLSMSLTPMQGGGVAQLNLKL